MAAEAMSLEEIPPWETGLGREDGLGPHAAQCLVGRRVERR